MVAHNTTPPGKKKKDKPYLRRWQKEYGCKYSDDLIEQIGDELLAWMESDEKNLWFKDFLIEKRIPSVKLSEFTNRNEYFAWIMNLCKDIQESRMFKMGLSKERNPAMLILGLKNNHGWVDRNDLTFNKVEGVKFVE